MNDCKFTIFPERAVLKLSGADCETFLQGLVTNDIATSDDHGDSTGVGACFSGLLTPQGKILYDFFLARHNGEYYLDVSGELAKELVKRLTFYKLRADVEIENLSDTHICGAIWNGNISNTDNLILYADPRLPELGQRFFLPRDAATPAGCEQAPESEYHAHRIGLGVPEGGLDYTYGDTFPHEACYDQLNGVDFRKGCYVGQEVVSRMQHRGTARKRMVMLSANAPFPDSGAELAVDGKPLGVLGSHAGHDALALVRLDRAAKAIESGGEIMVGDTVVSLRVPPWADYELA